MNTYRQLSAVSAVDQKHFTPFFNYFIYGASQAMEFGPR
jgi:hypothetical protein